MDEHFLHYVWKHQTFSNRHLTLTNGQPLVIFHKGFHNLDSGPDFEEGRVKIGEIEWAGSIEIHVYSSDWMKHKHHHDQAYNNVILHVVWSHDEEVLISNRPIPTLELKKIVDPELLVKYQKHLSSDEKIVCSSQLGNVPEIMYGNMLDRVAVERLESKATEILTSLSRNKNDWENTTYHTLARNFGFSTNKTAFIKLAQRLPFDILKKNLSNQRKTEALLFGQAGFLKDPLDTYQKELKKEHEFLTSKFNLSDSLNESEWKLGKMRPDNFPLVRIAQFASLMHQNPNLFSSIISVDKPDQLIKSLQIKHSMYWQSHYGFGRPRKKTREGPGNGSLNNLVINTVSPILAAYSKYVSDQRYIECALILLEAMSPEVSRHTKEWSKLDKKANSALESQAQIQLIKNYCEQRKCLDCNIGVHLLSQ